MSSTRAHPPLPSHAASCLKRHLCGMQVRRGARDRYRTLGAHQPRLGTISLSIGSLMYLMVTDNSFLVPPPVSQVSSAIRKPAAVFRIATRRARVSYGSKATQRAANTAQRQICPKTERNLSFVPTRAQRRRTGGALRNLWLGGASSIHKVGREVT
ncbi:hypothetical protein DFH11DRAFT_1624125 [Phellopilus nigrolimitatus]|nr:hypothetical protein DFH11DRAFT_1624125 [Phellopilus nigrolimitatus]